MTHRTFFSFHYERDVWRATIVRNSSKLKPPITPEWIESSILEAAKTTGGAALKRLIENSLIGPTVTAVLIGAHTTSHRWIRYEINSTAERGNGPFGIYIHNIKDRDGHINSKGSTPLANGYPTYEWVYGDGYTNLGSWVDAAYDAR